MKNKFIYIRTKRINSRSEEDGLIIVRLNIENIETYYKFKSCSYTRIYLKSDRTIEAIDTPEEIDNMIASLGQEK